MTSFALWLATLACILTTCSASGGAHGPIQSFCHRKGDFGQHGNHHGGHDDHGSPHGNHGNGHGDSHSNGHEEAHGNHDNSHGHAHGDGQANSRCRSVHLIISLVIGTVMYGRQ